MKLFAVLFAIFLTAAQASAQVTVEVALDSEGFVANEPLIARVRINNSSGSTLRLGETPDWLTFVVEPMDGPFVKALKLPEVVGAFDLESSKIATKKVDLAPCFDLTKPGRFKIVATVKVPAFNSSFASGGKAFFISNGTKRWEKSFGVPPTIAPLAEDGSPEMRKYHLLEANFASESRLYIRVTDRMDNNIRVIPVGALLSFSRVDQQLDKWMNLHLLYQNGAHSFLYYTVNPAGFVLSRERHDYTETRPMLMATDEGRITVRGGLRRYTGADIPPVEDKLIGPPELEIPATKLEELPVGPKKKGEKKAAPPANAKDSKKK